MLPRVAPGHLLSSNRSSQSFYVAFIIRTPPPYVLLRRVFNQAHETHAPQPTTYRLQKVLNEIWYYLPVLDTEGNNDRETHQSRRKLEDKLIYFQQATATFIVLGTLPQPNSHSTPLVIARCTSPSCHLLVWSTAPESELSHRGCDKKQERHDLI